MSIVNIIDLVIIIWIMCALINGYATGLIIKIAHLLSVIVSYVASYIVAGVVAKQVTLGVASHTVFSVSFIIAFIVINVFLHHLINVFKLVDHIPVVGTLNHIGGAVVGVVVAVVVIFMLCNVFFKVMPQNILNTWGLTKAAIKGSMLLSAFIF